MTGNALDQPPLLRDWRPRPTYRITLQRSYKELRFLPVARMQFAGEKALIESTGEVYTCFCGQDGLWYWLLTEVVQEPRHA